MQKNYNQKEWCDVLEKILSKKKLTIYCIVLEKKYQVVDVKKNILSKYIVLEIISGVEISHKQTIIYEWIPSGGATKKFNTK